MQCCWCVLTAQCAMLAVLDCLPLIVVKICCAKFLVRYGVHEQTHSAFWIGWISALRDKMKPRLKCLSVTFFLTTSSWYLERRRNWQAINICKVLNCFPCFVVTISMKLVQMQDQKFYSSPLSTLRLHRSWAPTWVDVYFFCQSVPRKVNKT